MNAHCHIATAIHIPVLNYIDEDGDTVDVTLVGIPTHIGPNVNAYDNKPGSKRPAGTIFVDFMSSTANDADFVAAVKLAQSKVAPGKPLRNVVVPALFIRFEVLKSNTFDLGRTELVTRYERQTKGLFWIERDQANAYCDRCWLKFTSPNAPVPNALIMCDVEKCITGRHQLCFDSPVSSGSISNLTHRCSERCRQAKLPRAAAHQANKAIAAMSITHNNSIPKHNHPPLIDSVRRNRSVSILKSSADGLVHNCAVLDLKVASSTLIDAGSGLFLSKSFQPDAIPALRRVIGYMFG